uniref:Dysfusion, isoform C n=2 Tax=Drosophila melanogaster TaxID=7227 RepID=A8JRD5_DROME|nr:dysfusion, isoform C [Drosophila melanogaster]ABW08776.1 dysfusion, isoform C [Drosophila melanogaster]|eukprot:NP_001097936.1 dysfusion, isoform C [Drosophila melanogaster]
MPNAIGASSITKWISQIESFEQRELVTNICKRAIDDMYADNKRGLDKVTAATPPTHALQQQQQQQHPHQQQQHLQHVLQLQQQQQQHLQQQQHHLQHQMHTHHNFQQHETSPTVSQQQHMQQQQPQTTQQQHATQQQQQQQQQTAGMFTRFDANKSTKGASKMRRDLINAEIANLRDLLPLPQSTRQRLSQLQLMALVCVYVRKANYFQQVFKRHNAMHHLHHQTATPNIGFSKALSGFLMMLTQNGKLLYISDNAAEYLGHSMEDLLIHGDSVYDIIDKQDHANIQAELNRNVPPQPGGSSQASSGGAGGAGGAGDSTSSNGSAAGAGGAGGASSLEGEHRMFLCRMNVSRNARRQMRFGDQKVVLVQGHYLSFLPLCSRNEPVFLATCTPIAMPETRECVVQGATNVFTTIHSMDMKIAHIDKNGEFHLGYDKSTLQGTSWYNLIHSDNLTEAQKKHSLIIQSEQDRSCILLVRMQRSSGEYTWVHVVLQVRDSPDSTQQPVIVCTNQVLNDREASIMLANSWLYHYYTVQSKIQFGMPLDSGIRVPPGTPSSGYYSPHSSHPPATPGGATPNLGIASSFGPHHHPHHSHHPHHHHHHHHPATAYHHHPHMGTYGGVYHAKAAIELKEDQPLFCFQEPVDYSQVNSHVNPPNATSTPNPPISKSSTPPPPKKRARKLEPLYLHAERSPAAAITPEPDCYAIHTHPAAAYATSSVVSSDASVIYATIVPTRPRLPNKSLPPDPADFIEQWNPSPPWSESAQKASLDSFGSSHELSPCITTTPPTPTSATPHQSGLGTTQTIGPAFSFEWMSDPLVPVTYQQWPPTGDHHQHLSQHLSQSQNHQNPLQQQQNEQLLLGQQPHLHQQHQHLALHHGRGEHSLEGESQGVVVVPPIPISIPIPTATGHGDAGEPVEDRG